MKRFIIRMIGYYCKLRECKSRRPHYFRGKEKVMKLLLSLTAFACLSVIRARVAPPDKYGTILKDPAVEVGPSSLPKTGNELLDGIKPNSVFKIVPADDLDPTLFRILALDPDTGKACPYEKPTTKTLLKRIARISSLDHYNKICDYVDNKDVPGTDNYEICNEKGIMTKHVLEDLIFLNTIAEKLCGEEYKGYRVTDVGLADLSGKAVNFIRNIVCEHKLYKALKERFEIRKKVVIETTDLESAEDSEINKFMQWRIDKSFQNCLAGDIKRFCYRVRNGVHAMDYNSLVVGIIKLIITGILQLLLTALRLLGPAGWIIMLLGGNFLLNSAQSAIYSGTNGFYDVKTYEKEYEGRESGLARTKGAHDIRDIVDGEAAAELDDEAPVSRGLERGSSEVRLKVEPEERHHLFHRRNSH